MCVCVCASFGRPYVSDSVRRTPFLQVSSQVSFCIKELLKKHPGIKGPVVKETDLASMCCHVQPASFPVCELLISESLEAHMSRTLNPKP